MAKIHVASSVLALLAYFSRRELFMYIVGMIISLISSISIMVGAILLVRSNNVPVIGSGLLLTANLFNR